MSEADIIRLIPPPLARDARVVALLTAFAAALDCITDRATVMLDPAEVPEGVLPHLSIEHSLNEFITPALPAPAIRTLIARAWELHEPKGYVEGIVGGLDMLGYRAAVTQWWQQTPQARRGTHRVDAWVGEPLWPGWRPGSADAVRAILQMIHAMQRWSQDHTLRLVSESRAAVHCIAGVRVGVTITIAPHESDLEVGP